MGRSQFSARQQSKNISNRRECKCASQHHLPPTNVIAIIVEYKIIFNWTVRMQFARRSIWIGVACHLCRIPDDYVYCVVYLNNNWNYFCCSNDRVRVSTLALTQWSPLRCVHSGSVNVNPIQIVAAVTRIHFVCVIDTLKLLKSRQ